MISQDRLIQEFMELVQVDSETRNERQIADVLKSKFNALGLEVTEDDSQERTGHGAGNLFITWPAENGGSAPKLLFTCHMDTVVPGQNIKPTLGADGWITSDGTTILGADDKAGLAALFEAIRVIQEQKLPHGQIQFVITAGEESGLLGARSMDPSNLDADFGFALDSNGEVGAIAVAAPTQAKITMQIFGKSAHAGVNPEDGISAIQVASKAIAAMKLGRIDNETTANIGKFAGGGPTNVVCDHVQLTQKHVVSCRKKLAIKSLRCVKHWRPRSANTEQNANSAVKLFIQRSALMKMIQWYSLHSGLSLLWVLRRVCSTLVEEVTLTYSMA